MDGIGVETITVKTALEPEAQPQPNDIGEGVTNNAEIPVIRKIERNAALYPDKIAFTYAGQQHSYAALISSAQQTAVGLEALGVTKRSRVAVIMHPCPELVCSLLGIHMLGATYVPIDPSFPVARVRMILEDITPSGVIFNSAEHPLIDEEFRGQAHYPMHTFEDIKLFGKSGRQKFLATPVTPEDESHIFFTSGTTGRPKGAISSHRNLAHGMSSSASCFELNSDLSILSVAGSSFSISTFELLSLLTCGGKVSIAQRSDILDIAKLFLAAKQVSAWHFVPTLLARLIDYIEQAPERAGQVSHLQRILTGGDNVPPDLLGRVRKLLPATKIYVNYGASETSCMVTYWPVLENDPVKTKIGSPQEHVSVLVLDKNQKEVCQGDLGELFVASPGVITGYLNRNDLNNEKFVSLSGLRYFATGDIVRQDENGLLEMLGREDFQIQLNGNRIELLEIESTLKRIESIKDCVIAARKNTKGNDTLTLTAYIVSQDARKPSVNQIRKYLSEHLPGYMIPSLFLRVEKIPTNHNGKIDRTNLPDPVSCEILQSKSEAPISGKVEKSIAKIWCEILGRDSVHGNSDFFELGGDSIHAVRATAKISDELDCNVTIADIVCHPTLKQLAGVASNRTNKVTQDSHVSASSSSGYVLLKAGNQNISPLLLINGVVEYLELAKQLETDRAIYAIYLPQEVDLIVNGEKSDATATTSTIDGITKLYLSVIESLQPEGPYYLAGKSYGGIIAVEVGRKLESLGHTVSFTGLLDTVVPDAFTAHKKLSFRITEHLKHTFTQGPAYIFSRLQQRIFRSNKVRNGDKDDGAQKNVRARHQVRKKAIFNTRLTHVDTALTLVKARDREYLYGERPSHDLGWSRYCANLTIYEVPGDHHSLLTTNYVAQVARHLQAHI